MLATIGALLLLQAQARPVTTAPRTARDTVVDSVDTRYGTRRLVGHRLPVTADVLATTFKDASAKTLFMRAREARLRQDSAILSYDVLAYQRVSAGLGFTKIGRDRLVFRNETATRVHWQRGLGAWVDVSGARTAMPALNNAEARREVDHELNGADFSDMTSPIPYYPGYEALWIGGSVAKTQVDESEIIHPLAVGAEAYYTFETGDSVSLTLSDKSVVQLRELLVRPRTPTWNVAVGSLWFESSTGQLVRAAYRLAVPLDVWVVAKAGDPMAMEGVPVWLKPMMTPLIGQVSAIAIEYGLYEGRFWLPRIRAAEGSAQASFVRVPFKIEQSFKYSAVNGRDTIPAFATTALSKLQAEMRADSVYHAEWLELDAAGRAALERRTDSLEKSQRDSARAGRLARRDSVRLGLRPPDPAPRAVCDTGEFRFSQYRKSDAGIPIAMRMPCDISKLEHSPDLPKSIYDPGDEMIAQKELDALVSEALAMGAQPPVRLGHLPPPTFKWGAELMRYNRVEGFSAGGRLEEQIGGGYVAEGTGRFGFADKRPSVDLVLSRTNLSETLRLGGYTHLVSASDWGRPLSFGSSVSALLFGRDEGFYYYASGIEVGGTRDALLGRGATLDWRVFAERQSTAATRAQSALNGADFPPNLVARRGWYDGVAARVTHSYGLDPSALRLLTDARVEAATGDSAYGRAALDVTASHGFGQLAGALTLSGGSSIGALPPQRLWYLGGTATVRGQAPDTGQSGNAYWFTRAELGTNSSGVRPTVFADLGWVGDRSKIGDIKRPMSGVGAGASFVDGLFRFDVARGLYPKKQFRVDLYIEARF